MLNAKFILRFRDDIMIELNTLQIIHLAFENKYFIGNHTKT